jgi:hypothetical protein
MLNQTQLYVETPVFDEGFHPIAPSKGYCDSGNFLEVPFRSELKFVIAIFVLQYYILSVSVSERGKIG